ncbi:hypothetical protein JTB14_015967 [Gonioctena quinquepunctata]|nr:hypothetical protein JTB14_015967 [Gonioctena quinquepunctata]
MRSEVQNSGCARFRLLKEVLSGNYPEKSVSKMNVNSLEAFVLRLVDFTSVKASAKTVTTIDHTNKPKWWPSDVLIKKSLDNKESTKIYRGSLKQLIINCCEFFRDYKQQWLPLYKSIVFDENFDVKVKGEKRKSKDSYSNNLNNKKRRTLLHPKKDSVAVHHISLPFVRIPTYEPVEFIASKPLNQAEFLGLFRLGLNNNGIPKEIQVPNYSRVVKLQNCPHIPLSSDIGRAMIKRENYGVPEYVNERKLERLEWYVNKDNVKVVDNKYEISFDKSKDISTHVFKFPRKRYHQVNSLTNFLCNNIKSLKVVLKNEDLIARKKQLDVFRVKVKVPKLSGRLLKKHLCKEAKVVLENKQVCKNARIVLERQRVELDQNKTVRNNNSLRSKRTKNR